ncbi:cytochrome P450 [Aspergillus pseudoustus]|uniref:Cytochrome P450 n=1 Tax=Aspergillus pseudoustus TaxID=1810923 RepID=A0ABR4JIC6_9EURO
MAIETVAVANITYPHSVVTQALQAAREVVGDGFQHNRPDEIVLTVALAGAIAAALWAVINNSVLSPLRGIPGPWLAGATSWYEFYYDVIKNGTYAHQHSKMHRQYNSTVIRISPNHVHVADPEFFRTLFAMGTAGSRFRKAKYFYNSIGISAAIGSHVDVEAHHHHRSAMAVGFTTKSIQAFDTTIVGYARQIMDIIAARGRDGTPVILSHHARAYTIDVIAKLSFGKHAGAMQEVGPEPPTIMAMDDFPMQFNFTKHFPSWQIILSALPTSVSKRIAPGMHYISELGTELVSDLINQRAKEGRSDEEYQEGKGAIFECLLKPSPKKQYVPPDMTGLVQEACSFLVGGSDTTGLTLQAIALLVLRNPDTLRRLREELDGASSALGKDHFDVLEVSKLPWLTAVIRESMRLYPATPGPLPREVPPDGIHVGKYFLPGGTIVSSSLLSLHYNPAIFPDPEQFKPERWLGQAGADLLEWWNPFSRGPRSCLGRQIAWHELATYIALLFWRFDLELHQSDERNLEWTEHMFTKLKAPVQVKIINDRLA